MEKVLVLLSTYNGEKYIRLQLDSILEQKYDNLDILIRDDGSSDATITILQEYVERYENIRFYRGDNVGTCKCFFDLMKKADTDYEYYAFSDQDDYWLPDKIRAAVDCLRTKDRNKKALYCSNVTLVNDQLQELPSVVRKGKINASFGNALIEDICTGCTCVMNTEMFLFMKERLPEYAIMHDWWFYLVGTCFGDVCYDARSYILYRQHEENVIGAPTDYFSLYMRRIKNIKKTNRTISRQVAQLTQLFELKDENKKLAINVIHSKNNILSRVKILVTRKIYRQNRIDNIIYKGLILLRGC